MFQVVLFFYSVYLFLYTHLSYLISSLFYNFTIIFVFILDISYNAIQKTTRPELLSKTKVIRPRRKLVEALIRKLTKAISFKDKKPVLNSQEKGCDYLKFANISYDC